MEIDDQNDQKDISAQDATPVRTQQQEPAQSTQTEGVADGSVKTEGVAEGAVENAANDSANAEPQKSEAQIRTEAEVNALKGVFADIRHQSRMSNLVTPDRWAEKEMIPEHLDSQQFVDLVFDVIATKGVAPQADEDEGNGDTEADAATTESQAPASDSADADVSAAADSNDASSDKAVPNTDVGAATASGKDDAPDSDNAEEDEQPEPDGALEAIERGLVTIPCADIVSMEGKETMYLYANDVMTDTYARWAFLANEDDKVATFVECVRQESKTYPRPMIYKGLMNHPFDMTEDEVLDAWKATQETNLYPDIESLEASNGDVYFFSTKYLDRNYAQSLAEYASVERFMNP